MTFYPKRSRDLDKYKVKTLKIDIPFIYPWTNEGKCFNPKDSDAIRDSVRLYIKKNGGKFWIRRHLAGMQVCRVE